MRVHTIGALVVLAFFAVAPGVARGDVITFTSLPAWTAATGGETWLVDFESFDTDTEFRTAAVDVGPFSLDEVGNPADPANMIDVLPLQFPAGSTSNVAAIFTNFGFTTIEMTFDDPVFAWGAQFDNYANGELLDLALYSQTDVLLALLNVDSSSDPGFFGFLSSDPVARLVFQSRFDDGAATGGERFNLDDVRGRATAVVPEPTLSTLVGIALFGLGAARSAHSRIPRIGRRSPRRERRAAAAAG